MSQEKSGSADKRIRTVKKLTLPDGFRVGIVNLGDILKEVADLKLIDGRAIKAELLERVAIHNHIPSGAKDEYAVALFREYQQKFVGPEAAKDGGTTERHQHTKG